MLTTPLPFCLMILYSMKNAMYNYTNCSHTSSESSRSVPSHPDVWLRGWVLGTIPPPPSLIPRTPTLSLPPPTATTTATTTAALRTAFPEGTACITQQTVTHGMYSMCVKNAFNWLYSNLLGAVQSILCVLRLNRNVASWLKLPIVHGTFFEFVKLCESTKYTVVPSSFYVLCVTLPLSNFLFVCVCL